MLYTLTPSVLGVDFFFSHLNDPKLRVTVATWARQAGVC